MIEQVLERIGLSKGEIKVYLALIELGSTTTWEITKKSGISGSKVYEVLNRLAKKGLVSQYVKNNVKNFEATNPDRLIDYLEAKELEISEEKKSIQTIIPQLVSRQINSIKSEAKIFTGFEGAKVVFEDAIQNLKKGDEILGWGLTEQPESWEIYFNKREAYRDKKGIIHKSIINEKYHSLHKFRKKLPNTQIRFFPSELEMPTTVEIWKDKVALFIITPINPITILIENKAAADSFRKYFHILWKQAKR